MGEAASASLSISSKKTRYIEAISSLTESTRLLAPLVCDGLDVEVRARACLQKGAALLERWVWHVS